MATLDLRLLESIETLVAARLDWLAFELIKGVQAGPNPLKSPKKQLPQRGSRAAVMRSRKRAASRRRFLSRQSRSRRTNRSNGLPPMSRSGSAKRSSSSRRPSARSTSS